MKETLRITESDMNSIAKDILNSLSSIRKEGARLVHLEGDLGAGKTTFTKALAEEMGINKEDVQSPTFILKREYTANHPHFRKLVHIDAYRFMDPNEGKVLKISEDLAHPNSLVVIEWPEKMKSAQPDMTVRFSVIDDDTRDIEIDL